MLPVGIPYLCGFLTTIKNIWVTRCFIKRLPQQRSATYNEKWKLITYFLHKVSVLYLNHVLCRNGLCSTRTLCLKNNRVTKQAGERKCYKNLISLLSKVYTKLLVSLSFSLLIRTDYIIKTLPIT